MEQEQIDSMEVCRHPKVLERQCTDCGQMMDSEYGVPFDYLGQGLRLSDEEITRLKDTNSSKLFAEKKLQLVLDLDNTLLHSKLFQDLKHKEKYLKNQTDDMFMFEPRGRLLMIKLRPLVRHFLKEVSSMFEMYIYTMGSRDYAKHVARLLGKDYFEKRVISRDDSIDKEKKSLDLVLGHESGVVILDDNYKVWPDHHKNLILMKFFTYFSKNSKRKSRKKDKLSESNGNGVLPYILTVLREIHGMFFTPNMSRDVRMLLREIRGQILKGCIVFVIDVDENKYQPSISNQAQELGAECTTILDSSVTHVVVTARTKEITGDIVLWAQLEKKILVHPWWIYITYLLWQRQPEVKFPTSN